MGVDKTKGGSNKDNEGFMTFQGHMGGEGLTIGSWGVGTSLVYHFIVCNSFNMIL